MKSLLNKLGKQSKEQANTLIGKTVMVGQYSVRVESLIGEVRGREDDVDLTPNWA